MAIYKRDIASINLETGTIHRTFLNHSIGYKDQKADHFGIRVFRDGEPVDLTGVSVQGVFMPPQGDPIAITSGNIVSGNVAEVVLPQACYNYDGQFCLAIKLVDATNSVTGTVRIVDGMVDNTHASGTVAPTSAVPTYQEVLSVYEQAIAAINKTVRFDTTQSLTDTQKATARTNIGAASVGTANELAMDIGALAEGFANESYMDLGNKYMPFRRGYYSTPAVGSASSYQSNSQYFYALVMCQPGDILHAHCYGNSTVYAWAFLDSNLNVLSRGGTGNFEGTQTAPASTSYVLVNVDISHMSTGFYAWVGKESTGEKISDLKSAIEDISNNVIINGFTKDYWYTESSSVITNIDSPTYHSGAYCIKVACTAGTVFHITGKGGTSSHRLYAFVDSSANVLSERASSQEVADNKKITAPTNSAYLVCSFVDTDIYPMLLIKNELVTDRIKALVDWTETDTPFKYSGYLNDADLNSITTAGWYQWTSSHVPTNAPWTSATGGRLLVLGDGSTNATGIQIAISMQDTPIIYTRRKSSGGWGSWVQFLYKTKAELPTYNDIAEHFDTNGVISSDFYMDWSIDPQDDRSIVIDIESKYTGESKPKIYFQCFATSGNRIYSSNRYMFQSATEYIKQSFRIPNLFCVNAFRIYFTIPTGGTLAVRKFSCHYDNAVKKGTGNVIFHAHRGLDKYCPPGSYNGIVAAAQVGFESCIGIPKFTSDGVAVEFHDDGNISSAMAQTDGSAIPSADDKPISQLTYDELMQYSIGSPVDSVFADAKILKIDDFFRICAETGMRPILSIHSADAPTDAEWQTLKTMADKYGLTKYLSVKFGGRSPSIAGQVINTFGNGGLYSLILLYAGDDSTAISDRISTLVNTYGLDTSRTRLDCEFFEADVFADSTSAWQQAQIASARSAGYTVSAVLDSGSGATTDGIRDLMNLGVTEFTDSRMYSLGLNW